MQAMRTLSMFRAVSLLPLVMCCAASLCSCKDKCQAKPAPDESAPSVVQPQDRNLLDYMIFQVGDKLRKEAGQPMWQETVRDMRNEVEAYYNKLRESQGVSERLVRMGLFLADAARELGAPDKALGIYTATMKDWDTLPTDVHSGASGQRIQSFLESGVASCLMQQRKFPDALPHYEKALQLDKERYHQLVPDDSNGLPQGDQMTEEIKQAAADLLASYRCLAECQLFSDDPEVARDTLSNAVKAAQRMKNLVGDIVFEYINLLSTSGNLESRVGEQEKALTAWVNAARCADALRKNSPSPAERAHAARFLNGLTPSIKTVSEQLKRQKADKDAQLQGQEQQAEPSSEQPQEQQPEQPDPASATPAS